MIRALAPLALLTALAATGCQHGAVYTIVPLPAGNPRTEVKAGKLDGHWFQRDILAGGSTETDAIELVYCPIVEDQPTVCRTTVVWQKGVTTLLER